MSTAAPVSEWNETSDGTASDVTKSMESVRRKRPRKARKRLASIDRNDTKDTNDTTRETTAEGLSLAELVALKEAQALREQSRIKGLDVYISSGKRNEKDTKDTDANDTADDVVDGLKSHFSVEQSGLAMDERMGKYIEEGMRRKFGDLLYRKRDQQKGSNGNDGEDQVNIFDIPEHLKVTERPSYDPSEGMPSAGLEELKVPGEYKINDEAKHQRQKKSVNKNLGRSDQREPPIISGNFSSNFAHHRKEWIETHLGSRRGSGSRSGSGNDKTTTPETETNRQADAPGRAVQNEKPGQKRFNHASDAIFAERYRKRWRRY